MATVPTGQQIYSAMLTASTAVTVTYADRYEYFSITNTQATSPAAIYVRTDGTAATVAGAECLVVMPGAEIVVANRLSLWYPSSNLLQQGVIQVGNGAAYNASTNPSTPGNPGHVTYVESLEGQLANPGGSISLISSAAGAFTIAGVG